MNILTDRGAIDEQLDALAKQTDACQASLGYPINLNLNHLRPLQRFFAYPLNNVGNPFDTTHYALQTWRFERDVLRIIADLYRFPAKEAYQGYITSGGTEGNFQALLTAREHLPEGRLYFSAASHYSIPKIAHFLRLKYQVIPAYDNGEIDYTALQQALLHNQDKSVILSLNIGTTMKGAIDNVERVIAIVKRLSIKTFYIHCDAALFGMMLPFIPAAPQVNFTQEIHSIAISGHKFIGSPFPCGIVLTRYAARNGYVEYIDAEDNTVLGSRNGHTPLILWYTLKIKGYRGIKSEVETCLNSAEFLFSQLSAMGYPCFVNPFSNIVLFKSPAKHIIQKWDLATEEGWSHIVVMQHVTRNMLVRFIDDVKLHQASSLTTVS